MSNDAPRPGPPVGPVGPDSGELRSVFAELLAESTQSVDTAGHDDLPVTDQQVEALGSAHELLAQALSELDSTR